MTHQLAGTAGKWYNALVAAGLVTEDEKSTIERTVNQARARKAAASKGAIPDEELHSWVSTELKPIVEACREKSNWDPLAARHFESSRYFKPFYQRLGQAKYWYAALVNTQLVSEAEATLIRQQARSASGEAIRTNRPGKFSPQQLQDWISGELQDTIQTARVSGNWGTLGRALVLDNHPIAEFAMRLKGRTTDWYSFLKNNCGVSEDQITSIKGAVAQRQATLISTARYRFSADEIKVWIKDKVLPVLGTARSSDDFSPLLVSCWKHDAHFGSCTTMFGTKPADWFGALRQLAGLTEAEERCIRQAGKERTRAGAARNGRSCGRLTRALTVVEHLSQSTPGQSQNFKPIIDRLSAQTYEIQFSHAPELGGFHVVLNAAPRRSELSAAAEFRLALGSVRTAADWDRHAASFAALQQSLSGYLTSRLGVLYLADLALKNRIKWPESAISVCAGDGALYRVSQEFREIFQRMKLAPFSVKDLDFSEAMLKLSSNPDRLIHDISSIVPPDIGKFNLFECSCPHRVKNIDALLQNASTCLSEGGILLMKVENIYFSDTFAEGLTAAGFRLIDGLNMQATLPEELWQDLPENLVHKAKDACRKTRFLVAERNAEAYRATQGLCTFRHHFEVDAEIEFARDLLRKQLTGLRDEEYMAWASDLRSLVSGMSDEARVNRQKLLTGLLKRAMRVLYEKELKTMARGLDGSVLPKLSALIESDLTELQMVSTEPDAVKRYLQLLAEIARSINSAVKMHGV